MSKYLPNATPDEIKAGILHSVGGYYVSNEGTKRAPSFHVWIPNGTHVVADSGPLNYSHTMTNNVRNQTFETPFGLISLAVLAEWTKEHFTNECWVYHVAISAAASDACDAPARTVLYQFTDTVANYEQCVDLDGKRLLEVLYEYCDEVVDRWRDITAVGSLVQRQALEMNGLLPDIFKRDWVRLANWCREQIEGNK